MRTYERYRRGDRVALQSMNDPYTDLAPGTLGTVESWQGDIGHLEVLWDTGSSLTVIPSAGDRVRPMGTNITYPLSVDGKPRSQDLPGGADLDAFFAALDVLPHPIVAMTPLPERAAWISLSSSGHQDRPLGGRPSQLRSHRLRDDLQLIYTTDPAVQGLYNTLAARIGAFVGERCLHCHSEVRLTGRASDGAIAPIPARHRRDLTYWLLAAGVAPHHLHLVSLRQLPITAAPSRPGAGSST